jgi:glycosyltransferase involved in cell wall biosynthesis
VPRPATPRVKIAHLVLGGELRGGERVALTLGRAARERGDEVLFLSPTSGPFTELAASEGFAVRRVDVSRTFRVGGAARLVRLLRHEGVDVLHTHTAIAANVLGRLAGRLAGVAVVSHVHIENYLPASRSRAAVVRTLDNSTARLATRILAVSEHTRDSLVRQGYPAGRIEVVPNGIEVGAAPAAGGGRPRLEALGVPAGAQVVGEIGRLCDVKGQRELIDALAQLDDVHGVLVGDDLEQGGRFREALERRAEERGLAGRVVFTGHLDDARELLAELDVFVLPSWAEGMPIVLLEAMAAGRPVVATPVGGTPEVVVHGETGLLVPPRDPAALAAALRELLADPDRRARFGQAGRRRVEERFSEEAMTRRVLEVYDELVG